MQYIAVAAVGIFVYFLITLSEKRYNRRKWSNARLAKRLDQAIRAEAKVTGRCPRFLPRFTGDGRGIRAVRWRREAQRLKRTGFLKRYHDLFVT